MSAIEPTSRSAAGNWIANQPYLLLCITALCWAGNAIVGRLAAGHIPPVTLSFLRWALAFLVILPFAWKHLVRDWAAIRVRLGTMIVLSLTGIAAFTTLQYWSLEHTQALNTLLLQSAAPLVVALWSLILLGVRLTLAHLPHSLPSEGRHLQTGSRFGHGPSDVGLGRPSYRSVLRLRLGPLAQFRLCTRSRPSPALRVSTSKQETSNQRRELEAVAKRSGWEIVKVYEDAGISGAKGRDGRPGLDAMLKAVNAKEFDLVATWSVDRLGRSLTDLLGILQHLKDKRVDLFLHQQGLDTSTTAGKAMFQLGVFAEFERGIIRERVNAGLARAREKGVTLGRPRIDPDLEKRIQRLRSKGHGILKIARELGIGTSAVQRVIAAA
jgi:DNA invertase Pin-like site-specific DNA recombinase